MITRVKWLIQITYPFSIHLSCVKHNLNFVGVFAVEYVREKMSLCYGSNQNLFNFCMHLTMGNFIKFTSGGIFLKRFGGMRWSFKHAIYECLWKFETTH